MTFCSESNTDGQFACHPPLKASSICMNIHPPSLPHISPRMPRIPKFSSEKSSTG